MRYRLSDILVTKRDGRKVPFNDTKICQAVKAAYLDNLPAQDTPIGASLTDDEKASSYAEYVMENVLDKLEALEPVYLTIEQIQDIVVKTLLEDKSEVGKRVAENYISYRAKRTQVRTINSDINQAIKRILATESKDNDDKRENANINTDAVMGQMLKVGSTVTKEFNLNNLINEKYSNLHRQGKIHLHDLDFMTTVNCLHIPLDKLLKNGFSTGHGYLRTPTTIQSASSLTCIAIQSSQNDFFQITGDLS
jgi:ribonucleoside-triphosphate reductase